MLNNSRQIIETQLNNLYINATSPYNDGWAASGYKKDLVMIQFMLNKLIKKCPNFGSLEDKWEQEITFEILKEKQ
jgi:hypothetical protein